MKKLRGVMLALAICSMCAAQANALEYTIDAPDDYLFGRATSVEVIHREEEPVNVDRSKNVSLIPPGFGSPTSYLPGSGEYLTPNLVPGALNGGLVPQLGSDSYTAIVGAGGSAGQAAYPAVHDVTGLTPGDATFATSYSTPTSVSTTAFTEVTDELYYSGGYLAKLKIPTLGLDVKVFEGTDNGTLAKGAGHFKDTSIWNGNVSIAGHNRGANCYFGVRREVA